MAAFQDTYTRWRAASFPKGSEHDAVDELHAELAQWDALVADEVIPIADGHDHRPGAVSNISSEIENLCARIELLANGVGPDEQAVLRQYRDYCSLLRDVYSQAISLGSPTE